MKPFGLSRGSEVVVWAGNPQGSHESPMTRDTRIALFLMGELVAALRANDPDLFKRWLFGGLSMTV